MSRDVEGFGILGLGASALNGQGLPHTGSQT